MYRAPSGSGYLDSPSLSDPPPLASLKGRSRAAAASPAPPPLPGSSSVAGRRNSSYPGQREDSGDGSLPDSRSVGSAVGGAANSGGHHHAPYPPAVPLLRTRAPPDNGPLSSDSPSGSGGWGGAPPSPSFFEKSANKLDELTHADLTPLADPERSMRAALTTLHTANNADRKELDWQAQHEALNDLRCVWLLPCSDGQCWPATIYGPFPRGPTIWS